DWSGLYSFSTSGFEMPAAIKFTPRGSHIIWGRTEYSFSFDPVTRQSVAAIATAVLYDGAKLDVALAPQAMFFLQDESGARLGATGIVRYDSGHSSVGATASWTGATHSSP